MEILKIFFWIYLIFGAICIIISCIACRNSKPYEETEEEHRRKEQAFKEGLEGRSNECITTWEDNIE